LCVYRRETNHNLIEISRMNETMKRLQKLSEPEQSDFVRTLFGHSSPTPIPRDLDEAVGRLDWVTGNLNESQKGKLFYTSTKYRQ